MNLQDVLGEIIYGAYTFPRTKHVHAPLTFLQEEARRAFLVVDMQEAFLRDIVGVEYLLEQQLHVFTYCTQYNIPVAVTELAGCGPTVEPISRLVRAASRHAYFTKLEKNGFTNPDLAFF